MPDGIGTLMPFKVGLLRLNTLEPPLLRLSKTLLEGFFYNVVQQRRRVLRISSLLSKQDSFHKDFNFENRKELYLESREVGVLEFHILQGKIE